MRWNVTSAYTAALARFHASSWTYYKLEKISSVAPGGAYGEQET